MTSSTGNTRGFRTAVVRPSVTSDGMQTNSLGFVSVLPVFDVVAILTGLRSRGSRDISFVSTAVVPVEYVSIRRASSQWQPDRAYLLKRHYRWRINRIFRHDLQCAYLTFEINGKVRPLMASRSFKRLLAAALHVLLLLHRTFMKLAVWSFSRTACSSCVQISRSHLSGTAFHWRVAT